jgi:hypothetical protein
MDLLTIIVPALFFLAVILLITGLVLLEKHDRNKSLLGDKWGVRAVIVLGLAALSCLVVFLIFYVVGLMFWSGDY